MWPRGPAIPLGLWVLFGVAACAADGDAPDPLAAVLRRESAAALAAARIGPAGGEIAVTEGALAGVVLTVPAGALGGDAVFSIYAGALPEDDLGYTAVGPAADVRSTAAKLYRDANLRLPFRPEAITSGTPSQRILVVREAEGASAPLGGLGYAETHVDAPIRTFGVFGAMIDPAWDALPGDGGGALRCEPLPGGTSLNTAISSTRLQAQLSMTDATVMKAHSFAANGCGLSKGWEVTWYSPWEARREVYSYWATGVTFTQDLAGLPCTPQGYLGKVDSTVLSNDFASRWGATPSSAYIEVRNCDASPAQVPPRLRMTAVGSGNWIEYDQNGVFVGKNF